MARIEIVRGLVALIDAQVGGGGGGTVLANVGELIPDYGVITVDKTIAAGASKCYVRNTGIFDIQVNGKVVKSGGQLPFEVEFNRTNNTQDFLPRIDITFPNGGEAWYFVQRPS